MQVSVSQRVHVAVKEGGVSVCWAGHIVGARSPAFRYDDATGKNIPVELDDDNPMGTVKVKYANPAGGGVKIVDLEHSPSKPFNLTWHTPEECTNPLSVIEIPDA